MDDNTAPNVAPISGMGGPAPDIQTPPAQVTAQPQQPQQPQAPTQNQQLSVTDHDGLFGKAAKMLMGGSTSYSVDQNGNTVATQSPNSFQSFAKNVLAAALLGGAAGANGNPAQGAAGGVVRGGAAELNQQQQQDLLKRKQAQEQFQNQNEAAKEQREASAAVTTDQLRKAQIARANAETYRTNVLTQGSDFTQHNQVALNGQQHFADYKAAGLDPIFKDVSEADMQKTLASRPGASSFDWEPTGVKVGIGADGQPTHEYTYSAYDPKGKIPVSQATIDQWKKDGMDKTYPELFNIVKAGKELDASQYVHLKQTDEKLYNDNLVRQKNEQGTEKFQADLKHTNAETASALATASHERTLTGMAVAEKTKQQALSNAYNELNTVGGDFDKLSPKSKIEIGESAATLIPGMNSEVRQILTDDPSDSGGKAKEIMGQIDGIRTLSLGAIRHGAVVPSAQGTTMLNPQGQQVLVTPDKMDAAVKAGYKPLGSPATPVAAPVFDAGRLNQTVQGIKKIVGGPSSDLARAQKAKGAVPTFQAPTE